MAKLKILVLTNGEKLPVTGELGKYWLTDGRRFRKLGQTVKAVEEVEIPESESKPVEGKPKKKSTKKAEPKEDA